MRLAELGFTIVQDDIVFEVCSVHLRVLPATPPSPKRASRKSYGDMLARNPLLGTSRLLV